jgi:TPP-dependent pyruvate/acetoin dehydrogenase alpha subunit
MDKSLKVHLLIGLYKVRFFEQRAKSLYQEGLIVGALHPYIGEEAVAVGACAAINKDDYILSTHRGHGHSVSKGADIKYMMAELMGKETGYCKGRGGSMHICDRSLGILSSNGIVGGGITLAAGAGISSIYKKDGRVTLCFFGDGAANLGVFHESLNMAGLWKLPVIFICENNQVAATTTSAESFPIDNISDRAASYNIYGSNIDGNDVEKVYLEIKERVEAARNGDGASLIECKTYRQGPHCMVISDTDDRKKGKDDAWEDIDPVIRYEKKLLKEKVIDQKGIEKLKGEIVEMLDDAVTFAKNSKFPDRKTLRDYVYAL